MSLVAVYPAGADWMDLRIKTKPGLSGEVHVLSDMIYLRSVVASLLAKQY